jgi:hypothetical protein
VDIHRRVPPVGSPTPACDLTNGEPVGGEHCNGTAHTNCVRVVVVEGVVEGEYRRSTAQAVEELHDGGGEADAVDEKERDHCREETEREDGDARAERCDRDGAERHDDGHDDTTHAEQKERADAHTVGGGSEDREGAEASEGTQSSGHLALEYCHLFCERTTRLPHARGDWVAGKHVGHTARATNDAFTARPRLIMKEDSVGF